MKDKLPALCSVS